MAAGQKWRVRSTFTRSSGPPAHSGTPLAPRAPVGMPGTHPGLHVYDVADAWLQAVVVERNVLLRHFKGINWILWERKQAENIWPGVGSRYDGERLRRPLARVLVSLLARHLGRVPVVSYADHVCETVAGAVVPGDVVRPAGVCHSNIHRRRRFHCESKVPDGGGGALWKWK